MLLEPAALMRTAGGYVALTTVNIRWLVLSYLPTIATQLYVLALE
jgi:hypothetical protein